MAFPAPSSSSFQQFQRAAFVGFSPQGRSAASNPPFDIFQWYPSYQECQRYFLDHAQHQDPVQAVAAFLNICLPKQRATNPINGYSSNQFSQHHAQAMETDAPMGPPRMRQPPLAHSNWVSLVPYIRRLIATGMDLPDVLRGFFGDDWAKGVGPLHEQERRNYLFAAKSGGWGAVKREYDISPLETVPFLRPLHNPIDAEISAAEKTWSEWLAMEDWMVGPRAPEHMDDASSSGRGRYAR